MTPPFLFPSQAGVCGRSHNGYRSVSIKKLLVIFLAVTFSVLVVTQAATQGGSDLAGAKFRNPSLPIDERVNDLISRMTLEEKVSQLRDRAVGIPRLGVPPYE